MDYQTKMRKRLLRIKELGAGEDNNMEIMIGMLRREGFVSPEYDFRNLSIDTWYLSNRILRRYYDKATHYNADDPWKSVWLRVITLAIADERTERPCDLNAWKKDSPPMSIDICTNAVHICAPAAHGWLVNLDEDETRFAGLSVGTIRAIIGTKKSYA